jgi:alkanesulfonate monooxygenase SsuD/methylene tetrahydromethanopterin reductase-like flavin-dependent oxidoreductase (luciferase family)
MHCALFLPLFDELSDPALVAQLSREAEDAGWDGVFVWDHLAYAAPVENIADPWITLAAIACATSRVRIGPMVTPLPRRRPVQVAREVTTLDHLSGGRVVLGVGIGDNGADELSGTGDELDPKVRGRMLDEALTVLAAAWTGEPTSYRGEHYVLDGLTVRPVPVQRPHPPVWVALRHGNPAPLRRAARHEGVFPIGIERPEQVREVVEAVTALRDPAAGPFDVAVGGPVGTDPRPYEDAGATWWSTWFSPYDMREATVRDVVRAGPPA